ncbi:hypothetical protein [Thermomonospora cellulosilytica]|uniref:Organic radical activating enzyme n=1 Tax=Thermomonospora cellulosilytica TaxID=1411118 RepID=A0A7W3N1R8_9ACTN|nr:hypothetical protein [Thermomonospora cellulosilytica]MBA9005980.1 organic radical activating enzyme [Thermomonospora cellulosilytica]
MAYQAPTFHEPTLALRYYGHHEVIVTGGEPVQVMMPHAVITLMDRDSMRAIFRAFVEGNVLAERVFGPKVEPTGGIYPGSNAPQIHAAVKLEGRNPRPTVLAKSRATSPSGYGQITIRYRTFAIICDGPAAWRAQYHGWRQAYTVAAQTWRLWDVASAEENYRERVILRLLAERKS